MKVSVLLGFSASALLALSVLGDTPAEAFFDETAATTTDNDGTADKVPLADDTERQQELLQKVKELAPQSVFVETFEDEELFDGKRWVKSSHVKYASQEASVDEYTVRTGHIAPDKGLVLDTPARHYGLAAPLDEPFALDGSPNRKELVVQYEVKLQKGLTCGGAYVKLLRASAAHDLEHFSDETPFVLMFGPDKCGSSDKVHLIFQHRNPVTDAYEEKHVMSPPQSKSDRLAHLYTAVVRDDNSFEVFIDQQSVKKGNLLTDFVPPVQPEKEIDDVNDQKPVDWVDEPMMKDPDAKKPADWDDDAPARLPDKDAVKPKGWLDNEPALVPDPSVEKPADWDDEDDGEWLAPQIANPKCEDAVGCGPWERPTIANPAFKGKWRAPMIANPQFQGEWTPRKVRNPAYFEDAHPARMDPIGALAVEVWTMSDGITFDNFWLGYDLEKAQAFANATWVPKHEIELAEQEKTRAAERLEAEARNANDRGVYGTLEAIATSMTALVNGVVAFVTTGTPLEVGGAAIGASAVAIIGLLLVIMLYVCCGKREVVDADVTSDTFKTKDSDAEENEGGGGSSDDSGFDNKPVVGGAKPLTPTTGTNDSSSSGDEQQKVLRQRKKKAPKVN